MIPCLTNTDIFQENPFLRFVRRWWWLVLSSVLVCFAPISGQTDGGRGKVASITVVSDNNYPPYIFCPSDNSTQGILVDQWQLWEKKTGVKVHLIATDWNIAQKMLLEGKADVIDTLFFTKERAKFYRFSKPYAKIEVPIFFHKNLSGIVDIDSLKGFTIGVKEGDACIETFHAHGITSLEEFSSYRSVIQAAAEGRIKVFSIDKPPALYYLYKLDLENEFRYSFKLYAGEFHRAVKKGRSDLLSVVENGFASIEKSELQAIEKKWMGDSFVRPAYYRYVLYGVIVGGIFSVILFFLNMLLRRQIRLKTADLQDLVDQLKQSEERFRVMFDQAAVGVALCDSTTGDFLDVNQKYGDIVGYSPQELKQMTFSRISHPDDLKDDLHQMGLLSAGDITEFTINKRYLHKNGTIVWGNLTVSPIMKHGQPSGVHIGILKDISEQKRSEAIIERTLADMRLQQQEISALLEASQTIPISKTFGESARRIFDICKEAIGAKSGYVALLSETGQENEVLFLDAGGLPCSVDPDLPMPVRGLREVAYRTKSVAYDNNFASSQWMQFMPDGHVKLDNVLFAPLTINDKTVGLIGLANKSGGFDKRDVRMASSFGNLAAVGLSYVQYQENLKKSEKRLKVIFNNAPAIMLLLNEKEEILQMNQTGLLAAGRTLDEVVGLRGGTALNCIGALQNPKGCGFANICKECHIRTIVVKTFETNQNFNKIETEVKIQRKNRISNRTILVSTSIVNPNPPKTVLVTIDDLTARKQLEYQIKQTQKLESIGNLAGGIAHDFNNIMFPIIGMCEMLLEDLPQDSLEHGHVQQILKAGHRGAGLVKQILGFSRQSEHKMIPVRVQSILKEVYKLARSTIPADIEILHEIQADCGLVEADPTQVHQIIMNLVTNAYHALEQGAGRIVLQLKEETVGRQEESGHALVPPGAYAKMSVTDTGIGIAPEVMDRIFEPYFTTKEKGKGTGLGLSVVYGIVKEHKGEITVKSETGKGTVFDVYLPLLDSFMEGPGDFTREGDAKAATGKEHILFVDDEKPIADLVKLMLERLGYHVTARVNSIEALQKFNASPEAFDLVITDMTMPNMTGDKLAGEILAVRPDMPIIICTGFSDRINEQTAEKIGVKGILMKPVVKSDMAEKVRNVLDGR